MKVCRLRASLALATLLQLGCGSDAPAPIGSVADSGVDGTDAATDAREPDLGGATDTTDAGSGRALKPLFFSASGCLRMLLKAQADGGVRCMVVEAIPTTTLTVARCEDISAAYCTPGAKPCRADGTDFLPSPLSTATYSLVLKGPDVGGKPTLEEVTTTIEAGSAYAMTSDGKRRLICETVQLAGGRVPQSETDRCRADASYTPSIGGGWCYVSETKLIPPACASEGALTMLRFFAMPQSSSELFYYCMTS